MAIRKTPAVTKVVVAAALLTMVGGACSAHSTNSPRPPTLSVEPAAADMDQPVDIRIAGLSGRESVSLQVTSTDGSGNVWTSRVDYVSDAQGAVDTTTSSSTNGSYTGTAGMGPIASMQPGTGPAGYRWPKGPANFTATVTAAGESVTTAFTRTLVHPGDAVEYSQPSVETDGFSGFYATTAAEKTRRHPAVLLLGGSQGGNDQ